MDSPRTTEGGVREEGKRVYEKGLEGDERYEREEGATGMVETGDPHRRHRRQREVKLPHLLIAWN